ncbi:MAG: hypothetical protein WEB06_02515 [Actinomycetota bacterium]
MSDPSSRPFAVALFAAVIAFGSASLASKAPATGTSCDGAFVTDIRGGVPVCVHASERPPAGVDLRRRPTIDELRERRYGKSKRAPEVEATESGQSFSTAANSVACVGDGSAGNRVQAIYARASNVPDRFSSVVGLIRQYAADADYQINLSAGQSGEGRRVRFVTESCVLSVASVTLSAAGDDSFSATRSEMVAKGFNRSDRKYLIWMDASVGICGLGELYGDDRATDDNYNNGGPSYARVDAPCWAYAEAHELLHTLGAVQGSAPNSSGAGHCIDENDTMCYTDSSGSAMTSSCPSLPSWQVDCSLDDYFNASSSATGYLATHWNVARSSFLEGAPPPPPPPAISVVAPAAFYAGNAVAVSASVVIPAGRTYSIAWSSSRTDCKFFVGSGATNTFYCPATSAGAGQVTAVVTDSLGMSSSASRTYKLLIPSKRRTTVATVGLSKKTISKGKSAKLTGKLVAKSNGKAIIGMKVSVYYRRAGSSVWKVAATRTTGKTGKFTLTVKPSKTTYYMLVSWYTKTWKSDQSSAKKLAVK